MICEILYGKRRLISNPSGGNRWKQLPRNCSTKPALSVRPSSRRGLAERVRASPELAEGTPSASRAVAGQCKHSQWVLTQLHPYRAGLRQLENPSSTSIACAIGSSLCHPPGRAQPARLSGGKVYRACGGQHRAYFALSTSVGESIMMSHTGAPPVGAASELDRL